MPVARCEPGSARAASALTRPRRLSFEGALSDSAFLGLGLLAFLLALTVQYGLYHRLLREPMRAHDLAEARPAMALWLKVVIAWQVVVGGGSVIYVVVMASRHTHGVAWIAPAIGAVFGTAIPLQVAVTAIMRIGRR